MAILVSRTYECFKSHDDEEDVCEADESGFLYQDSSRTFRELVDDMKAYDGEMSSMPSRGDPSDWINFYDTDIDYEYGTRENESLHYSRANPPRNAKYWRWALIAAGLIRA